MLIEVTINGYKVKEHIEAGETLYNFLRARGCLSVKCGCESSMCGLCTVLFDEKPVLSCSMLAARADGHSITTLEGVQKEAEAIGAYIAGEGADQCGFCNPGYMMNTIALLRENPNPTEEEVLKYLSGNLCRCSGYQGQLVGIMKYVKYINSVKEASV